MAKLSRAALETYDRRLTRIADAAASKASSEFGTWRAAHPEATVADVRDYSINLVNSVVDSYGDAACELSARLYDAQAQAAGATVPAAELPEVSQGMRDAIDSRVRYVVGDLVDEDSAVAIADEALNANVGDDVSQLAREEVTRRANETMAHNVARDASYGVRYARVPMGDGCEFCMMLSSRGFVYHSASTAGEFNHFHTDCRCKVIAGFPEKKTVNKNGLQQTVTVEPEVEGYDPDDCYHSWQLMKQIDGMSELTDKQKRAARQGIADGLSLDEAIAQATK
jgi:hypothetical protein